MINKIIVFLTLLICCSNLGIAGTSSKSASKQELTAKQMIELALFKNKEGLLTPLTKIPGNPNRFKKDTLYVMRNFKIIQKIKDGYLITTEPIIWSSGSSMEFNVAFLKTQKKLPADVLISGYVIYSGDYKYNALNGFEQIVPLLKVPAGLQLSGNFRDGDPSKPEYF
jgi:hypothetical protein